MAPRRLCAEGGAEIKDAAAPTTVPRMMSILLPSYAPHVQSPSPRPCEVLRRRPFIKPTALPWHLFALTTSTVRPPKLQSADHGRCQEPVVGRRRIARGWRRPAVKMVALTLTP